MKRGRGKAAATMKLIEAAVAILAEIHPASIRAVCYRLFVAGLIDSMSKNNTNKVSTQLVWAREQGILPWDWVVDETREAERVAMWSSPTAIFEAAARQYRRDYWETQPNRVEVWSEKGTIRGTLAPVLNEFGVTFRVMHGYGSATALYGIAQESVAEDKPLTVFYVGDWDPSGMQMSEIDIPARMERYQGRASIRRIALTAEDVGTDLPSFDADDKQSDTRYRWFLENYGARCWELDALSPVVLRERVRNHITSMLDLDVWEHEIKIEAVQRESINSYVAGLPVFLGKHGNSRPGGPA